MKNRKFLILGALLVSCLLSVTGCKKQETNTSTSTNFGQLDATEASSGANSEGIGLEESIATQETNSDGTTITTEAETDPFAISGGEVYVSDPNLTEQENKEQKEMQEDEKYQFTDVNGRVQDERDAFGVPGILKLLSEWGGIDEVVTTCPDKDKFEQFISGLYTKASKEDIDAIINTMYGEEGESKEALRQDVLHSTDNWIYTEDGWYNLDDLPDNDWQDWLIQ